MPWYAVIDGLSGQLLSVGSVVAETLPPGVEAITLASRPTAEQEWDETTRSFVARPAPEGEGDSGTSGPVGGRVEIDLRPLTGVVVTWANMPAAETDFLGAPDAPWRKRVDLVGLTQARLTCNQTVAGATNALLKAQASADGATWADLCSVAVGAGTGVKVGAWSTIAAAAHADVHVRLRGVSGDGKADPAWHYVSLEAR